MIVSVTYDCFENIFPSGSCNIVWPKITYPIKTEAEGRMNGELFSSALSVRAFAKEILSGKANGEFRNAEKLNYEIRCVYNEGLFLSFFGEGIISLRGGKPALFHTMSTYRTSSASRIRMSELIKPPFNIRDIAELIPEEDLKNTFLTSFNPKNFCITTDSLLIIIPGENKIITLPLRKLKEIMRYEL